MRWQAGTLRQRRLLRLQPHRQSLWQAVPGPQRGRTAAAAAGSRCRTLAQAKSRRSPRAASVGGPRRRRRSSRRRAPRPRQRRSQWQQQGKPWPRPSACGRRQPPPPQQRQQRAQAWPRSRRSSTFCPAARALRPPHRDATRRGPSLWASRWVQPSSLRALAQRRRQQRRSCLQQQQEHQRRQALAWWAWAARRC